MAHKDEIWMAALLRKIEENRRSGEHPTSEQIVAYAFGDLEGSAECEVGMHLFHCAHCSQEVDMVQCAEQEYQERHKGTED